MLNQKDIKLFIDGMGIVIYSDNAMLSVPEGEDFFTKEFAQPQKVAEHIKIGDIICFNTGSSGEYTLYIRGGYPNENILEEYPIAMRLALDVKGNKVSFIDLFWLFEWNNDVPEEQKIEVEEGIYHITLLTKKPKSGVWGDKQEIYIFFNKIEQMPNLQWNGVPCLFTE